MSTPNISELQAESAQQNGARRWLVVVLVMIPAVLIAGKSPALPTSRFLTSWFSLADMPVSMHKHIEYVLFVPISAIIVAFARLTLGLPVLSLFRPILVAVAFRMMGIPAGLLLLAMVLGTVLAISPLLKGAHYYARVPIQLSIVAAFLIAPLITWKIWPEQWLRHLTYFPLISLALICEAFTKTLDEKGLAEAAWPTVNTVAVGTAITLLARIPGALHGLVRFPELLLAQAGVVLLISEHLRFEWLKDKNPFARSPRSTESGPAADVTAPLLLVSNQSGE